MLSGGFEPPLAFTEEINTFGAASKATIAHFKLFKLCCGQWEKKWTKEIVPKPHCHREDSNLREPSQILELIMLLLGQPPRPRWLILLPFVTGLASLYILSSFCLDDGKKWKKKSNVRKHMPSGGIEPPSRPLHLWHQANIRGRPPRPRQLIWAGTGQIKVGRSKTRVSKKKRKTAAKRSQVRMRSRGFEPPSSPPSTFQPQYYLEAATMAHDSLLCAFRNWFSWTMKFGFVSLQRNKVLAMQ
jgi:hypothetical protein